MGKERLRPILKVLQIVFYLAFVFLWFKDNYAPLRVLPVSPLWAFIPLVLTTAARFAVRAPGPRWNLRRIPVREAAVLGAICLLAVAIRIPFLLHGQALLDSDDMIPILSGKHIAEGQTPAVYFYGFPYEGTGTHHLYALVFKIFGYTVPGALMVAIAVYLAFLLMQYLAFRELFSSASFAAAACLFYALPIGYLLAVSFHLSYPPFFLFLGSLAFFLAVRIHRNDRDDLVPALGFCLGLAFWTHPLSAYFVLSLIVPLAVRWKLNVKPYLGLFFYGCIGAFPVILDEIARDFQKFRFLTEEQEVAAAAGQRLKTILSNAPNLLAAERNAWLSVFALLLIAGLAVTIAAVLKNRRDLPRLSYVILAAVTLGVHAVSGFHVDAMYLRYMFPLYLAIPFFLAVPIHLLKTRFKTALLVLVIAGLAAGGTLRATVSEHAEVRKAGGQLTRMIEALDRTGERHWTADYWQALLITGLSGERLIAWDPRYHGLYRPYRLMSFNDGENNNYVFFNIPGAFAVKFRVRIELLSQNLQSSFAGAAHTAELLSRLGIEAKDERIGDFGRLIYGLPAMLTFHRGLPPLPPKIPGDRVAVQDWSRLPAVTTGIPELEMEGLSAYQGRLDIRFRNTAPFDFPGFRIWIKVPGYSSRTRRFSPMEETLNIAIPAPPEKEVRIAYGLDYLGLPIPSTHRETVYVQDREEIASTRDPIVPLSGFGPNIEIHRRPATICEKEIRFELNGKIPKMRRLLIVLWSPFDFEDPAWHGEFVQTVEADINGVPLFEAPLVDGRNTLVIPGDIAPFEGDRNILTLRFRYHLPFDFARLWKTSALLEHINWE